ncbi:hypothetical protein ABZ897_53965 [Nonomuraea sp. NPDC046802]|uniref:hypothetical protein n=1 Tax=Nonomuraea sp. NPDC046802 TaxID=3154919 RepID=UPI0033C7A20E
MSMLTLPTYDPERLADVLRQHNLPGQRTKTAITFLRRQRRNNAPHPVEPRSNTARLHDHLIDIYEDEILRRGGEIAIRTHRDRHAHLEVTDRDPHARMVLLRVSAYRYYSRRISRPASLSYLCGKEDGQLWAVRVPGTITTVVEALHWITPPIVRAAQASGRRVLRQGDVYAIQTAKAHDGKGDLPDNHQWNPQTRTLTHPEHGDLLLPFPVRFVPQKAYGMGRGAGHAYAD